MYTQVKGKIVNNRVLNLEILLASGMAVKVLCPVRITEELEGKEGLDVLLHVYTVYKEDAIVLYGFTKREDRDLFEYVLNTVDGVGPKTALGLLNRFAPADFLDIVTTANTHLLSKCPGIGAKSAEKVIFCLKDKVAKLGKLVGVTSTTSTGLGKNEEEAVSALVVLGLGEVAAKKKVAELIKTKPDATTEWLVTSALK